MCPLIVIEIQLHLGNLSSDNLDYGSGMITVVKGSVIIYNEYFYVKTPDTQPKSN